MERKELIERIDTETKLLDACAAWAEGKTEVERYGQGVEDRDRTSCLNGRRVQAKKGPHIAPVFLLYVA